MTSSNYQSNSVDLDSTYIVGNDPNYRGIQAAVTNRKTVIFGQQLLTQTYPIGNLNNAINYAQSLPGTLVDQDSTTITGVAPTAVFYKNRANTSQSLIRANFGTLLENTPQINTWYYYGNSLSSPIQVGTTSNWAQVACGYHFSLALTSNGTLYGWGTDLYNLQTSTLLSTPSQIGTNTWSNVTCGYRHTLAIQTPGTLWAWGYNNYGQLGLNTSTYYSSPIQIGALTTWIAISGGYNTSLAIQSNGTLWAWGYNNNGQLGLNDTTNRSSPVQVGTLTTWIAISGGYNTSLAIQSNGTLWAWGYNSYGQLGQNDITNRSSPTQVGLLSSWTQASCGYNALIALQNNGTLWAAGSNGQGQLGINSRSVGSTSSPVQVGTTSSWARIGVSGIGPVQFAIQSNGTLWAWGSGALGLNTVSGSIFSPVQIGTLSSWSVISNATWPTNQVLALQTNRTLWSWGGNSYGQLGIPPQGISATKIVYGL